MVAKGRFRLGMLAGYENLSDRSQLVRGHAPTLEA